MYRHNGHRNCGKLDGWAKIAADARIDGRGACTGASTKGAAKHAGSWEKTLKFRARDARNRATAGELACKNFPDFRCFSPVKSLDIRRKMVKMSVVLSSAKQAGAVARELDILGLPDLVFSRGRVDAS